MQRKTAIHFAEYCDRRIEELVQALCDYDEAVLRKMFLQKGPDEVRKDMTKRFEEIVFYISKNRVDITREKHVRYRHRQTVLMYGAICILMQARHYFESAHKVQTFRRNISDKTALASVLNHIGASPALLQWPFPSRSPF